MTETEAKALDPAELNRIADEELLGGRGRLQMRFLYDEGPEPHGSPHPDFLEDWEAFGMVLEEMWQTKQKEVVFRLFAQPPVMAVVGKSFAWADDPKLALVLASLKEVGFLKDDSA